MLLYPGTLVELLEDNLISQYVQILHSAKRISKENNGVKKVRNMYVRLGYLPVRSLTL